MEIITGFAGICLGFVTCLAWVVYTKSDLSFLDDKIDLYPEDRRSPNRMFIERYTYPHGDRRLLNQSWPEQVVRAHKVMPVNKPVLISNHKDIMNKIWRNRT